MRYASRILFNSAPAPEAAPASGGSAPAVVAVEKTPAPAADNQSLLGGAKADSELAPQGGDGVIPGSAPAEPGKTPESKPQEQPQGAPEKYGDFKLPEGIQINKDAAEKFSAVAKDLNLSQEQAQKLVDLQAGMVQSAQQESLAQYNQQLSAWKDSTIKALGAGYQKELGFAAKFLDRFGSPNLRQFLNESGIGNHPELALALVKAGKAISEDPFADSSRKAGAEKSVAELMYPNQTKK